MNAPHNLAAQAESKGSFDDLCRLHAARAWGFASRLTVCSADADDVMQDAFVVAWKKRDVIPVDSWPWFCTVVSNCARNHRRKTGKVQRMPYVETTAQDPGELPEQAAQAAELRAELVAALGELGPEEHQAVALCVLGGFTQAAASEMTGTNLNTIKARVRRGLERLREKLKKRPDSIEAFMALPVLPYPADSLPGAVARWSETARDAGAATGAATAGFSSKSVLVACIAILVIGTTANVAYNIVVSGSRPPELNTTAMLNSSSPPADGEPEASSPLQAPDFKGPGRETEREQPGVTTADEKRVQPRDPTPLAGQKLVLARKYYPSGLLEFQGTAYDTPAGQLYHGQFVAYHESGEMKAEYTYVHGALHGAWSSYFPSGKIEFRGDYADNQKHGIWTYFNEDGSITATGEYFDDKKVGTWTMYYPNGDERRLDTYSDGNLSGVRKDFAQGGVLIQTTEYIDSKKNGFQIEYSPETGKPVRESHFKDGEKDRPDRLFDPVTGVERAE